MINLVLMDVIHQDVINTIKPVLASKDIMEQHVIQNVQTIALLVNLIHNAHCVKMGIIVQNVIPNVMRDVIFHQKTAKKMMEPAQHVIIIFGGIHVKKNVLSNVQPVIKQMDVLNV